jgi:hypothetical protein
LPRINAPFPEGAAGPRGNSRRQLINKVYRAAA